MTLPLYDTALGITMDPGTPPSSVRRNGRRGRIFGRPEQLKVPAPFDATRVVEKERCLIYNGKFL